jgi:hypothetical protein
MIKQLTLAAALLCGTTGNFSYANETVASLAPTQAVGSQAIGRQSAVTANQRAWLNATMPERIRLAEEIGEAGARQFAGSKGWTSLFDGTGRTLAQGPDQIYQAADKVVHVIEAKGGTSALGHAYGHPQGSSNWAVESARRVIHSNKASVAERKAAAEMIRAASEGRMQVHVVRTKHVLGEPTVALLEQTMTTTDDAAKAAARIAATELADDVLRATDDVATAASNTGSKVLRGLSRAALPVAATVDVGLRGYEAMEVEESFAQGNVTEQQRETAHAKNAAGLVGGWGGALAGAKLGATGGGVAGTALGGVGAPIGVAVGGIAGGVAGYIGGEAAAEAAADWTMDKVHRSGNTISGAAGAAKHKAQDAWNYVW